MLRMLKIFFCLSMFMLSYFVHLTCHPEEKHIVIIVPSFNNALYYKKNLNSIISQEYSNYHVVYIDDCSQDNTGLLVEKFIQENKLNEKFFLIKNNIRCKASRNIYYAIHTFCKDNDIVAILDGDDWFAHTKVLNRINIEYQNSHIWRTNGNFIQTGNQKKGEEPFINKNIISKNLFRKITWHNPPLRTYYAWLYKKIKLQDLLYHGEFFSLSQDAAKMYPIMEMAGEHFSYIPDILYIYNTQTPLNDFRSHSDVQVSLVHEIKKRKTYTPLKHPDNNPEKCNDSFSCSMILFLEKKYDLDKIATVLEQSYPSINHVDIVSTFEHASSFKQKRKLSVSIIPHQNYQSLQQLLQKILPNIHEFCIVCHDDFFNIATDEDITTCAHLLRKTKGLEIVIASSHYPVLPMQNTSLLSDSWYTFQLGWRPVFSCKIFQKVHIFSTHELSECLQYSSELFNKKLKLNVQHHSVLKEKSGLIWLHQKKQ